MSLFISGLLKLTVIDYVGYTACTVFLSKCNFQCPFCHNSQLIGKNEGEKITVQEFFGFLDKRKNVLDAVCVSGGEPLLSEGVVDFIRAIKSKGFRVKLDTNGSCFDKLKQLIDEKLVDYVAMDVKNCRELYSKTAGVNVDYQIVKNSIDLLLGSGIDYEFRTTVVKEYHSIESLLKLALEIKGAKKYSIQNYKLSDGVLDKTLTAFTDEELKFFQQEISKIIPNTVIK